MWPPDLRGDLGTGLSIQDRKMDLSFHSMPLMGKRKDDFRSRPQANFPAVCQSSPDRAHRRPSDCGRPLSRNRPRRKAIGPGKPLPGPMMTNNLPEGLGKAGIDRGADNTRLEYPSVRCSTPQLDQSGDYVSSVKNWFPASLRLRAEAAAIPVSRKKGPPPLPWVGRRLADQS